jgi:alkanesulfonate monooxygenase SsuD/methylene tetrahydromethanopterin reductase-like flavin-dependent oxidoreductase (luciferase family)
MTGLGVVFRPQLPPERLREVARVADEAGLAELWLWEDCFFQGGVSAVAATLAWTERLHVGVGLLPVPLRNVALAAMEATTLHRMFPGRAVLAFGHGAQEWMGQAGARVESPLTLIREYLAAMRALLNGERVTTAGRYVKLDDVALEYPPPTAPPLLMGAIGPRSLRLAGEVADGTVLTASTSPALVRRARELIDEGRATAGRTDHHQVVVYLLTGRGPDGAAQVKAEFERYGDGDIPDIGVTGNAETVATAVRRLAEAGADRVILQPTDVETDVAGFIRFVTEEVRPLIP